MRSKDVEIGMLVRVTDLSANQLIPYREYCKRRNLVYSPYFYIRGWDKFTQSWWAENTETLLYLNLQSKSFENMRT